ncbi:MAG: hypothetical protein GY803_22380 [Chloroflexi bacterium]|nr:hypothetical protein [Chloroflexota bacterium]
MGARRFDAELVAKNYGYALKASPQVIKSWDPGLWRGPRILVPIKMEALVVTTQNAAGPWAKVKINPEAIPGYADAAPDGSETGADAAQPEPFETYSERATGVHLHWALPDGLTKGVQEQTPEEVPPEAEETELPEQPEAPPPQETDFPVIPDRWLVVRMYAGSGDDRRRRVKAWVIESEEDDPAARVTPLAQWKEDRSDEKRARWMTALGQGDPAFAAYYDNVRNILGFHDDLESGIRDPLSYQVLGWYSHPEDDPLHQPKTKEAWFALLEQLGWTLDGEIEDQEKRVEQAADEAKERLGEVGLQARYDLIDNAQFTLPVQTAVTGEILQANFPVADDGDSIVEAAVSESVQSAASKVVSLGEGMAAVADASLSAFATEQNEFAKYWPRQILCHGLVVGVFWNGHSASVSGLDDRPKNVGIAVGNTAAESISALVAEKSDTAQVEKILSAFHYGMLPELSQPDGLATLESLLHGEDFVSKPGGFVVDTIDEGDLFPQRARSEVAPNQISQPVARKRSGNVSLAKETELKAKSSPAFYVLEDEPKAAAYDGIGRYGVNLSFQKEKFAVQDKPFANILAEYNPSVIEKVGNAFRKRPRRRVPIRRAMPRYFEPRDPVILLTGAGRAYKHGEDGYYTDEGKLICRITGETIHEMSIIIGHTLTDDLKVRATVTGIHVAHDSLLSGQIPPECAFLYDEALFLDHTNAPIIAESLAKDDAYINAVAPAGAVVRDELSVENLTHKAVVEQTMLWQPTLEQYADAQAVAALSGMEGKRPSPLGHLIWRQPWTPLHLDWEVAWFPSPNGERDWRLGENDLARIDDSELGVDDAEPVTYTGRTLLTPAISRLLADRITKFLEDEEKGESDLTSDAQETVLDAALSELKKLDVLACSFGGLHDLMIGLEETYHFTANEEGDTAVPTIDETAEQKEDAPLFPVRAGHFRLQRLRLIDAFGRFFDVSDSQLSAPIRAADVEAEQPDLIQMPPRIVQPSRLMFRLLSAESDEEEATKLKAPVCGWIMPDHLDEALEVYDTLGINQGQVQVQPDGTGLEWQSVPGNPGPLGGPPNLENTHLDQFVGGMLTWGLQDTAAASNGSETELKESALSAFLRMTDATLWTVDPLGREGNEHLSVLVGRPLALVRAQLRLELEGEPVTPELARTPFAVRLGALTRLHDGLIGYFVNDDYSQLYPVHETIAAQTRVTRPRQGFLGAIQTVDGFYKSFNANESIDPVDHPYINTEPTIKIRPQQTVRLTLIVDPRGGVHATSGILPRKRIELMREHVAQALDNISITFRIGPVLSDPETIRMPLPAEIKGGWSWVRRTSATVWQVDPVVNETDDAQLSATPAHITEGWLKLSGALNSGESDSESETANL